MLDSLVVQERNISKIGIVGVLDGFDLIELRAVIASAMHVM